MLIGFCPVFARFGYASLYRSRMVCLPLDVHEGEHLVGLLLHNL